MDGWIGLRGAFVALPYKNQKFRIHFALKLEVNWAILLHPRTGLVPSFP
jgi:hypothetical protein